MNEQTKSRALPRRQRIIRRPRLTRLLDEAAERCRILMLIAPAGYGKTTLAREWVEQEGYLFAWLTAGPSSADVVALAADMATAVSEIVPGGGARLAAHLESTRSAAVELRALPQLLADGLSNWPQNAWLVIDDYQLLEHQPEALVIDVVERSALNLLVATRRKPKWARSRRFLYGEIAAIDHQALAMTIAEVETLVGKERDADLARLMSLSSGWPAVVGLAALNGGRLPKNIPDHLYDYLADEVMNGLTPEAQNALLDLALVRQVDSAPGEPLGVELPESARNELVRAGLLQVQGEEGWTVHPLMRAFLRTKLSAYPSATLNKKLERIFNAYLAHKRWDDAFATIVEFGLIGLLPNLLSSALSALLIAGRIQTLERWIDHADLLDFTDPTIDLAAAEIATRRGEHARGQMFATRALEDLDEDSPLLWHAYYVAAHAHQFCGASDTESLNLATHAVDKAPDVTARAAALWRLFAMQCDAEQIEATETLSQLERLPPRSDDDLIRKALGRLQVAFRFGNVASAGDAAKAAWHTMDSATNPLVRTSFCNSYAAVLYASGDYEEALKVIERGLNEGQAYGLAFVEQHARVLRCTAEIGLRHFVSARREANQMLSGESDDPHVSAYAHGALARILMFQSRLDEAVRVLATAPDAGLRGTVAELLTYRGLAEAAQGTSCRALRTVAEAEELSRSNEVRVLAGWVRAICALSTKAPDARELLHSAVVSIETTGWIDRFITAYRTVPELLGAVAANPEWEHLARRAVRLGRDNRLARRLGINIDRSFAGLTRRELEVLALVADGLTNDEIARRLFISVPTAKVHVRHILEKLGVHTRTQAALLGAGLTDQAL